MIVAEWTTEDGTTIRIDDSAYRDKTEEELEAARQHVQETIRRCLLADARKKMLLKREAVPEK